MAIALGQREALHVAYLRRRAKGGPGGSTAQAPETPGLLEWTEAHRMLEGRPLKPSLIPWLRDLYAWQAPELWVMKASQVFISEWMVSVALWAADTGYGGRGNVAYIFPTQAQMDDFVQGRVDPAIQQSEYLTQRSGTIDVRTGRRAVQRVRLKRVGRGHIYFRGSDKRTQVLSVDADVLDLDEVDEFKPGVVDTVKKRLNSARSPLVRAGSTPKYPASGIAPVWATTTRRRYFLPCPSCGKRQPLVFPDNLRPTGELVCASCGAAMNRLAEGEWVAEQPSAAIEGLHVNRLYSPRADLVALASLGHRILSGLISDQTAIQEFWNQDMGLPHAPAGGSLTDPVLLACIAQPPYTLPQPSTQPPVYMGVDVGAVLHVWIKEAATDIDEDDRTRSLWIGTVRTFDDLGELMTRYDVTRCVIDAEPEGHKTTEFVGAFPGRVWRCFYPSVSQWRHDDAMVWDNRERTVLAHRTRSMDAAFARFFQRKELLPDDAPTIPGLFPQLKAPVRILVTDAAGRTVAKYDEGSAADHFAHAATYCEIARLAPVPGTFEYLREQVKGMTGKVARSESSAGAEQADDDAGLYAGEDL